MEMKKMNMKIVRKLFMCMLVTAVFLTGSITAQAQTFDSKDEQKINEGNSVGINTGFTFIPPYWKSTTSHSKNSFGIAWVQESLSADYTGYMHISTKVNAGPMSGSASSREICYIYGPNQQYFTISKSGIYTVTFNFKLTGTIDAKWAAAMPLIAYRSVTSLVGFKAYLGEVNNPSWIASVTGTQDKISSPPYIPGGYHKSYNNNAFYLQLKNINLIAGHKYYFVFGTDIVDGAIAFGISTCWCYITITATLSSVYISP